MNNSFLKFEKGSFAKKGFILFIASGIGGICNFGYHIFMIRNLSPADYGILNSLIALLMFVTQPAATIYMATTKFSSKYFSMQQSSKTKHFMIYLSKRLLIFAFIFLAIGLFFSRPIAGFMQIENSTLIVISAFVAFFSLLLPIFYGMLSGYQKFGKVGFAISFTAVLRLLLGMVAVLSGLGIMGILSFWNISLISALFLLIAFSHKIITGSYIPHLKKIFIPKREKNKNKEKVESEEFIKFYKYLGIVVIFSFLVVGIMFINMILVKHFFSAQQAGYFSIAQTVGKLVFFLPLAFPVVMFARSSAAKAKGDFKQDKSDLKKALFFTVLFSGAAAVLVILFPGYVVTLISGELYKECLPLVRLFASAMCFFSISFVMFNYNLAVERYKFLSFLFLFLILETALIILFHNNLIQVLIILNIIAVLTLTSVAIYTFFGKDDKSNT